ncbi:MAG TPA: cell division protein FtsL [Terriglobales bacterium]|nr:cell division protein FtsL [Terriglobales bacterium]
MDVHFRQQIDNSRLVRVSDPARRRELQALFVLVGLAFAVGFGWAWMRFDMVRLGYQIESARQQQASLEQWNRGLELQQAALRSPVRIYALAEARLGMQSAKPGQMVAMDLVAGGGAPVMAANAPPAIGAQRTKSNP